MYRIEYAAREFCKANRIRKSASTWVRSIADEISELYEVSESASYYQRASNQDGAANEAEAIRGAWKATKARVEREGRAIAQLGLGI